MSDPASQVAQLVCADNGAYLIHVLAYLGGLVGAASLVANFRSKMPPAVASVIDALALNFAKTVVATVERGVQVPAPAQGEKPNA